MLLVPIVMVASSGLVHAGPGTSTTVATTTSLTSTTLPLSSGIVDLVVSPVEGPPGTELHVSGRCLGTEPMTVQLWLIDFDAGPRLIDAPTSTDPGDFGSFDLTTKIPLDTRAAVNWILYTRCKVTATGQDTGTAFLRFYLYGFLLSKYGWSGDDQVTLQAHCAGARRPLTAVLEARRGGDLIGRTILGQDDWTSAPNPPGPAAYFQLYLPFPTGGGPVELLMECIDADGVPIFSMTRMLDPPAPPAQPIPGLAGLAG